jgi:hypothetical protein
VDVWNQAHAGSMEENPAGLKLKQARLDYPPKRLSNKTDPD